MVSISNIEELKQVLDKWKVEYFSQSVTRATGIFQIITPDWRDEKVEGYPNYQISFEFDADGNFLSMAAAET